MVLYQARRHEPTAALAVRQTEQVGRVVVVTGASKGIGRELSLILAKTGAVIVPTVRTQKDAKNLLRAQVGEDVGRLDLTYLGPADLAGE